MKKIFIAFIALIATIFTPEVVNAQSLSDIFKNMDVQKAVTSLTGGEEVTVKKLKGNWTYMKPSVTLEGNDPLKNLAGSIAASALEDKIREYSERAGIKEGKFKVAFNNDNTFSGKLNGKSFKGNYTIDNEVNVLIFSYAVAGIGITSLTAKTVLSGKNLSLLFEADKLLDFIIAVSNQVENEQLKATANILSQYQGLNIGVELKK